MNSEKTVSDTRERRVGMPVEETIYVDAHIRP